MKSLVISDLHLTDNSLEEYRWEVFDWIHEIIDNTDISQIFILGDLTEKKDNHSAKLVNNLVSELYGLAEEKLVTILRGNHDGIDPEWPFFSFLKIHPNIEYFYKPTVDGSIIYLPHSKDLKSDLTNVSEKYFGKFAKLILMHQTVKGAIANNGFSMEGFDSGIFSKFNGLCLSGDIHKPQTVGKVVYVGSPYPVYFGDDFIGGGIILNNNDLSYERIEFKTIRRVMLELDLTTGTGFHFTVKKGDQFKVKLLVNRSDSDKFEEYKKVIKKVILDKGGVLVSMELMLKKDETNTMAKKRKFKNTDPETVLNRYCKVEGLDDFYQQKGKEFL